jgi:hypothetical protein
LDRERSSGKLCIVAVLAFPALGLSVSAGADKDRVQAGLATWKAAGCAECHGKFADGNPDDDDLPNIVRASQLNARKKGRQLDEKIDPVVWYP